MDVALASRDSSGEWGGLLASACASGVEHDVAERVLNHLVRGPDAVIEVRDAAQLRVLAAVVDTCVNAHDVAALEVLAGQPEVLAQEVVDQMLALAEVITARGPRQALDVVVDPARAAWTPVLEDRAYRPAYAMLQMARDLTREDAYASAVAPPGWRWRELGPGDAEDYRRLLLRAFRDTLGAFVPSRPELSRWLSSVRERPEVLCTELDRPVGWVFVTSGPAGGVVRNLGRDPSVRGQGLGDLLLERGLRKLARRDVGSVTLEVADDNAAGLALYDRHGFAPQGQTPVLRRTIAH